MGLYDDRVYLELTLSKSIETDKAGNYIVYAEASNENLDFQDQVVLQRALMESKDYFLKNGVISWDHLHLKTNNPEYIIGEPLGVEKRGGKTFVKAMLYKGNKIVEDVVSKLQKGSTIIKTSVGGKRPVVVQEYDSKMKKAVEKIVSVLWDELAITFKPVNQTLTPVALTAAAFVKSLSAGYATDSALATGGSALIPQDLYGNKKSAIHAVITAIAVGEVRTPEAGREVLSDYGIEGKEANDILEEVVNRRKKLSEVFRMDDKLSKSFEDAILELEKAIPPAAPAPMAPAPAPRPAPAPAAPSANTGYNQEEEEDEEEEEQDDGYGYQQPVKKSVDDDVEFLDVSPILASFTKSLSKVANEIRAVRDENAELRKSLAAQDALLKSMGNAQIQSARVLKSLSGAPVMRKSVLSRQERFDRGSGEDGLTPEMLLAKSTQAVQQGKMTMREATILEDRINKGMDVPESTRELLKSL